MKISLAALSDSVSALVASFASVICAVRVDAERHVTGFLIQSNSIVTPNRFLPALDFYTAVFGNGTLASARRAMRDPISDLAVIEAENAPPARPVGIVVPAAGSLLLMLSAGPEGTPCARLAMVNRLTKTPLGPAPVLDATCIEPGSILLDGHGRLAGIATTDAQDQAVIIPVACLQRFLGGAAPAEYEVAVPVQPAAPKSVQPAGRPYREKRAWLGVSLQPITVPEGLVQRAGQSSGRMVVSMVVGGPADTAGLEVGDVLLTMNGLSMSGERSLRDFLNNDRIGSPVEITLLRSGTVMTVPLIVGAQPN